MGIFNFWSVEQRDSADATVQNNKINKIFNVRDIFSSFVCIKH